MGIVIPEYLVKYPKGSVYEHGLPFSTKLGENLDDLRVRVEKKKASLIVVDGGVGEGKTSIAVHIADYYNGGPIDFQKQLALGGDQVMKKLQVCYENGLGVLIYDEAGDFNKRGSLTKMNAILNRVFETFRTFKIIIILVLPSFGVLDNQLFENKIPRLLLHLDSRTERQGNFRGYSLHSMLWIRWWMRQPKLVIKERAYDKVDHNFVGHFLDLPPKRSKELDIISTKGKLGFLEAAGRKMEGLVSYHELATKVGRSENWLRVAVSKMKIQPARVEKGVKYFDVGIVDRLRKQRGKLRAGG